LRYNGILLFIGITALSLILYKHLYLRIINRFVLLLIIGTMFTSNIRFYHGEVFTAILASIGLAALATKGWGWGAVVLGVLNTPVTFAGLFLVAIRRIWISKKMRFLLPLLLTIVLILVEAKIRLGSFFTTGYENDKGFQTLMPYSGQPGFSYPFFFGLLSILFSFGKGLIFFAPGLLLPLGKRVDEEKNHTIMEFYRICMMFLLGMILIYSKWWSWYGGWSFGPRFFLFASIPASLTIAVYLDQPSENLLENLLVLTILTLSVWVGVCGAVFHMDNLRFGMANNYALEPFIWYVPEFSALWHPFINRNKLLLNDYLIIIYADIILLYLGYPTFFKLMRQLKMNLKNVYHSMKPWSKWGF
jgi:hypothetical protein